MTFVSEKLIHGKKRYYLEKSIRLPNGKAKKISVYLKDYKKEKPDLKKYHEILDGKIKTVFGDFAVNHYKQGHIFTEKVFHRLEEIKIDYKKIIRKLTRKQLQDMLDRFTINFTYESNAIEGSSLTLKDVTFIIQEGKIVKGKDLREVYETINTRKAMEWIFNEKPKLNEATIIKLHQILVENTGISFGYKKLPNFLLGRNVKTTSPENVKEEMDMLLEEYNNCKNLHPLQLAVDFHGKFEKIHPFEDGNGRTGRLLINIILMNYSYPPLIIRKIQKMKYFHALSAFDQGHSSNLYYFLIEKYKKTFEKFFEIYVKYL